MGTSLGAKITRTIQRIIQKDPTVYLDLKSYARTKRATLQSSLKRRVRNSFQSAQSSINVSQLNRLSYSERVLFDLKHYCEQSEIEFTLEDDAREHFNKIGEPQNFNPHPLIDIELAKSNSKIKAQGNFLQLYFEKPELFDIEVSPLFDTAYYRTTYHWTNKYNPLVHFLSSGFISRHNPSPFFDTDFYIKSYGTELQETKNPYLHFLNSGWKLGHSPHPLIDIEYLARQLYPDLKLSELSENPFLAFLSGQNLEPSEWFQSRYFRSSLDDKNSTNQVLDISSPVKALKYFLENEPDITADPSSRFSAAQYRQTNPDIGKLNSLYHYLRYGQHEGRKCFPSMPSALNPDLEAAHLLEPELVAPNQDIKNAKVEVAPRLYDPVLSAGMDLLRRRGSFTPDIIYLFRGFVRGGAERYGGKLISQISELCSNKRVLILAMDTDEDEAMEWFDLQDNTRILLANEHQKRLTIQQKAKVLAHFIQLNGPELVINNNSHVGWECFKDFGKALAASTELAACLYCYDFDEYGNKVGYARDYLRSTVRHVDKFIVDNSKFADLLIQDFSISSQYRQKFHTVPQLNEIEIVPPSSPLRTNDDRAKFLWAARVSRQKNLSLLREVAEALPEYDFAAQVLGKWDHALAGGPPPSNLKLNQRPVTFDADTAGEFCGFLSTSNWEGLPTTIIEATAVGLPIIATDVGGVSDLISNRSGWLVQPNDTDGFVDAVRACIERPDLARTKVKAAQKLLASRHSQENLRQVINEIGFNSEPKKALPPPRPGGDALKHDVEHQDVSLDFSIVINGHREGSIILPTIRSCIKAFEFAVDSGYSGEILFVLDNPDSETTEICSEFTSIDGVRLLPINVRDLGLARNVAARAARGRYIAFMDGDDMMSENWVRNGIEAAERYGENTVLHPASNYIFGNGETYIFTHRDMTDPEFELSALAYENYYTAISMASKALYLEHPYEPNLIDIGLAFEDWSWNSKTINAGIQHRIVTATSHYIRRKPEGSLLSRTSASGALARTYYLRTADFGDGTKRNCGEPL